MKKNKLKEYKKINLVLTLAEQQFEEKTISEIEYRKVLKLCLLELGELRKKGFIDDYLNEN